MCNIETRQRNVLRCVKRSVALKADRKLPMSQERWYLHERLAIENKIRVREETCMQHESSCRCVSTQNWQNLGREDRSETNRKD